MDFRCRDRKLKADIFKHAEKTKLMLGAEGKLLIDRFKPTFYNFFFTFP
jgi:hypothetical protein